MFSLDDDVANSFTETVAKAIDEYNSIAGRLYNDIEDVCGRANNAKITRQCNGFYERYNEKACGELIQKIKDGWIDSQKTIADFADRMGCGDEACDFAKSIEERLVEKMDGLIRFPDIPMPLDGGASGSVEYYQEISGLAKSAKLVLEEQDQKLMHSIDGLIEENSFFASIAPLLSALSGGLTALYENLALSFVAIGEQFRVMESQQVERNLDAYAGAAYATVGEASLPHVNKSGSLSSALPLPSGGATAPPKCFKKLKKHADAHWHNADVRNTQNLIKYIVECTMLSSNKNKKELPYSIIAQLMPVYEKYFKTFGHSLVYAEGSKDQQARHAEREFMGVLKERGALEHFSNSGDEQAFKSSYKNDYTVLDTIARMAADICRKLESKEACSSENMLIYVLYVLEAATLASAPGEGFGDAEYNEFSQEAAKQIYGIIGVPVPGEMPQVTVTEATPKKTVSAATPTISNDALTSEEMELKLEQEREKYACENAEILNKMKQEHLMEIERLGDTIKRLGDTIKILQYGKASVGFIPILRHVEEIRRKTEDLLNDKKDSLVDFVKPMPLSVLITLIGFAWPPLTIGTGIAALAKKGYDLSSAANLRENKIDEFEGKVAFELFPGKAKKYIHEQTRKGLEKIVSQKHMNIATSCLSYLAFKDKSEPSEMLPPHFYQYIYNRYYADKEFSEALHTYYGVMQYCINENYIDWSKVQSQNVLNAIYFYALYEVLPALNCSEDKINKYTNELLHTYGMAEPVAGFNIAEYWNG